MENLQAKKDFLKNSFTKKLAELDPGAERLWGKMNVQQMIEHMADYLRIANGRTVAAVITPEEHLPQAQGFLMSDKPFRENTPNSLMAEEPPQVRNATIDAAIAELQSEINHFFEVYEADPSLLLPNPFFGFLNFDMQVQLLHKHAWHHLRQFGMDA